MVFHIKIVNMHANHAAYIWTYLDIVRLAILSLMSHQMWAKIEPIKVWYEIKFQAKLSAKPKLIPIHVFQQDIVWFHCDSSLKIQFSPIMLAPWLYSHNEGCWTQRRQKKKDLLPPEQNSSIFVGWFVWTVLTEHTQIICTRLRKPSYSSLRKPNWHMTQTPIRKRSKVCCFFSFSHCRTRFYSLYTHNTSHIELIFDRNSSHSRARARVFTQQIINKWKQ